ncbi:hypothetical protein EKPV-NSW-ORF016 [Eastern grey kangaroopox virus]|uniref:Uncharacterized protein n=1 Tax=Eastern grey kangaroopox virus TaxID=2042482 RepID=A0A2H4QTC3_9POXV|nr:hypothetical protein EKPV-NSW-ORF016 [Eastern grey kangaroopox virus]
MNELVGYLSACKREKVCLSGKEPDPHRSRISQSSISSRLRCQLHARRPRQCQR